MLLEFGEALNREVHLLSERIGPPGAVVMESERSEKSILRFLALLQRGFTVFPLPSWHFRDPAFRAGLRNETQIEFTFWPLSDETFSPAKPSGEKAGFIVRTSGSSGKPKFILHDPELFRKKYQLTGKHFERTFLFSPADSIAGIETILESQYHNCGLVVTGDKISPASVISALNSFSVDYFQTTPSFLNLMMVAGKFNGPVPVKLKKIAFGSEPAQEKILRHIAENWKGVTLIQTYGMSEIGIQKTLPVNEPWWFSPDQAANPIRIRSGSLEVKSLTPLVRYLNATAEFTPDGWFITHDEGEARGEEFRVSGRAGDLINVAGRKFYPIELEELLLRVPGILDVTVKLIPEELLGGAVMAEIISAPGSSEDDLRLALRKFLETSVPTHMHPRKIIFVSPGETERFKKFRRTV